MLILVSSKPHEYTPINGLAVDEADEQIKALLLFTQVPDLDSIDFKAFNIVQRINHLIEERKKAIDVRRQEYEEWLEKLKALPKEQQDIFHKDKYLPGFPNPLGVFT